MYRLLVLLAVMVCTKVWNGWVWTSKKLNGACENHHSRVNYLLGSTTAPILNFCPTCHSLLVVLWIPSPFPSFQLYFSTSGACTISILNGSFGSNFPFVVAMIELSTKYMPNDFFHPYIYMLQSTLISPMLAWVYVSDSLCFLPSPFSLLSDPRVSNWGAVFRQLFQ